jgi:hypothetical protein
MWRWLWLFFSIAIAQLNASSFPPRHTREREFSTHCHYFENLYFSSSTFVGFGIHSNHAIAKESERGYSFKTLGKYPFKKDEAEKVNGTTIFLCESSIKGRFYLSHYFHLLEHMLGIWSSYGDQNAKDVQWIVCAGDGNENLPPWQGPNEMNLHLLKALFPNAFVQNWSQFVQTHGRKKVLRFERAILSDRALTSDASMLQVPLSKESILHVRDCLHVYAKTIFQRSDTLRVTYLKRPSPRTLAPDVESALLQSLSLLDRVSLRVVNFANTPYEEQINLIGNTDILIGVHGNDLSHALYMNEGAALIEIFPPMSHSLDYRSLAELRGIDYLGIISGQGVVDREEAARLGRLGNLNVPVQELDFMPILSLVHAKLLACQRESQ